MSRLVIHVDIDLPPTNDPIEVAEELFYGGGSAYGVEGAIVHASWDAE